MIYAVHFGLNVVPLFCYFFTNYFCGVVLQKTTRNN